jgi:hypothetical protein
MDFEVGAPESLKKIGALLIMGFEEAGINPAIKQGTEAWKPAWSTCGCERHGGRT